MTQARRRAGRTLRPFTTGLLVSQGFRTTLANLVPFMLLTLICMGPALIWEYMVEFVRVPDPLAEEDAGQLVSVAQFLLSILLGFIAQAALCYGTIQYLSGRRASFGECIGKGLSRLLPVIGVSLVTGAAVVLGLILLIVPGLIFMCMLYVAVPAAVVESSGVGRSLHRSIELTRGFRISIFLAILALGILGAVFGGVYGALVGTTGMPLPLWVGIKGLGLFFNTVGAVFAGVAYVLLRERKEGVQVAELADVFA